MRKVIRLAVSFLAVCVMYTFYSWYSTSTSVEDAGFTRTGKVCWNIEGFETCPYYQAAKRLGSSLENAPGNGVTDIAVKTRGWTRSEWETRREELKKALRTSHRTSPFVWKGCGDNVEAFIGGFTDFEAVVLKN
ncbi:hypothetical protein HDU85_001339 [Gaertneriomyces sp. JEL0708]|nr:hypothetical protein HDU85_001339 [Gaertneriomyces sp. JEL0708]